MTGTHKYISGSQNTQNTRLKMSYRLDRGRSFSIGCDLFSEVIQKMTETAHQTYQVCVQPYAPTEI
jgi:hypothetical protein